MNIFPILLIKYITWLRQTNLPYWHLPDDFLHYYHLNSSVLSSELLMKLPDRSVIWGVMLLIMWNLKPDPGYTTVFACGIRYFLNCFMFTIPFFLFSSKLVSNLSSFFRGIYFFWSSFFSDFCALSLWLSDLKSCVKFIMELMGKTWKKVTEVAKSGLNRSSI